MVEGLRYLQNHLVCTMEIVLTEDNEISITPLAILKLPLTLLTSKSTNDMIYNSFIPLNAHKFLHFLVLALFTKRTKHIRTAKLHNKSIFYFRKSY